MIPLLDLKAQYQSIKEEIDQAVLGVLESGQYILGPNVTAFEEEVAAYLGVKHAVGVASGTDALILSLLAIGVGPGDEVIVPAYSFFATAGAVLHAGARPVFVDINPETYLIDPDQIETAVTKNTRAIIPVHLYGQPADMSEIQSIADQYKLHVIEDNAQAFGASYKGRKTGSIGDLGCLSFFPSKNLGAYGDGGMVTTNDDGYAEKIRKLRTHGWTKKYFPEMLGYNSRLDEIQAAVLRVKLKYIDGWNEARRRLAYHYNRRLMEIGLRCPVEAVNREHVYHLYMVRVSGPHLVQEKLREIGIASGLYYPQPLHLSDPCVAFGYTEGQFPYAEQASRELLALPLYPELNEAKIDEIIYALYAVLKKQAGRHENRYDCRR